MSTRIDPDRSLAFLIHDIARMMRKEIDARMARYSLTRSQWWVLAHLYRDDGITQTQLAEVLDVGLVTLSGLLMRLEEKCLVRRREAPSDGRAKLVYATRKARSIFAMLQPDAEALRRQAFQGFSQREHDQVLDLLIRVKQNLTPVEIVESVPRVVRDEKTGATN
jgi:DNA-binding MarR family transcriptional regulator